MGLMSFCVGDAGALLAGVLGVVVVVVVGVVMDGAWLPLPPHAAVSAPIAMSAAPPATAKRRRPKRCESILQSYLFRRPGCFLAAYARGRDARQDAARLYVLR